MKTLTLLIAMLVILSGCSQRVDMIYTEPNGVRIEYHRRGPQQVGEVLIETPSGGQFLMDGSRSQQPPFKVTTPYGWVFESGEVRP